MRSIYWGRISAVLLTGLLVAGLFGPGVPGAVGAGPTPENSGGQVSAKEDNPPGCVTVDAVGGVKEHELGEETAQCGAQGRDHFASPVHRAPITACKSSTSTAGSRITRIKPNGPRRPDGRMAFMPGACLYLPPGYATSGLRYPVVYLLHGGGGDQADWVTFGAVQKVLDGLYAKNPAQAMIAVMPDGRNGQWFDYADGSYMILNYVTDHLIPWVDGHLRTIGDRRGRAITGLSNGGYGALHIAGKAPDLFRAAGSMSGNLGASDLKGLYTEMAPGVKGATTFFQGSLPSRLIPNMDNVDLTIDWGATCSSDASVDLCATWSFEQSFRFDNQKFRDELIALKYKGTYEYREAEGAHAWRWWTPWLRDRHLPFFLARLSPPEPDVGPVRRSPIPSTFRYRSVLKKFSVWGYDVVANRPVLEFLELRDVTAGAMKVIGSGPVMITTAPRYSPGRAYAVKGAGLPDAVVLADPAGRLRVAVDLGPAHTSEQYLSVGGEVGQAQGHYFTERQVTIAEAGDPSVVAADGARPAEPAAGGDASFGGSDGALTASAPGGGTFQTDAPATENPAPAIDQFATDQAAAPSSTSAPAGVPATAFMILLVVIGLAAGFADRVAVLGLLPMGRVKSVVLGLAGSLTGGVLGYALLGFDFDGGAIQPSGVLGAVVGSALAVTLPSILARRRSAGAATSGVE